MTRRTPKPDEIDLTRSHWVQVLLPSLLYLKLAQRAWDTKRTIKDVVFEAIDVLLTGGKR